MECAQAALLSGARDGQRGEPVGEGWRSDGAAARHRRWRDGTTKQDQAGRRSPTTTTAGSEVGPPPERVQRRPQVAQLDRRWRGGVRPLDAP